MKLRTTTIVLRIENGSIKTDEIKERDILYTVNQLFCVDDLQLCGVTKS